MNFHEEVRNARLRKQLTRQEAAELAGVTVSAYNNAEYGYTSEQSLTSRKIKASGLLGTRIVDIPDFYERLDSVCNEQGKIIVHKNHPVLQDLRESLGVPVMSRESEVLTAREDLARQLRRIREEQGLSQREAAEIAGVSTRSYVNYEHALVMSKTHIYHKIINSDLFEEEMEWRKI